MKKESNQLDLIDDYLKCRKHRHRLCYPKRWKNYSGLANYEKIKASVKHFTDAFRYSFCSKASHLDP